MRSYLLSDVISVFLLYENSTFWVVSRGVMRGGDGLEMIMATKTPKVKKMDDNGQVNGKEYVERTHGELEDGGTQ